MLMPLGRGPLLFRLISVETALDEEVLDLPLGARGFIFSDRAGTAVLRVSNVKGEVAKASNSDPKPVYWSLAAAETGMIPQGIMGMRVMQTDAEEDDGSVKAAQVAGTILEQRYYLTSETASTDIEIVIYPGT